MAARALIPCTLTLLLCARMSAAAPGDLDPTFGTGGIALGPVGSNAEAIVRQPDGKLVVAGYRATSPLHFFVARYDADGTPDASFGTGGVVETPIGTGHAGARGLVLQPDGKIVAAGSHVKGPSDGDFALVRYQTDGTLDPTFGAGGIVTTGGPTNEGAFSLVLQTDGKLVAAGTKWTGTEYTFALARYEADGTLDATFGSGGWVTGPGNEVNAILQQPDGKLVVAGYDISPNRNFALARYETDGTLDASFGTNGMVTTSMSFYHDQAFALVRQADGGFVAAGLTDNGFNTDLSLVLVRYDAVGVLDASFGTGGISTKIPGALYRIGLGLVEQPDGKLVMAAHTIVDALGEIAVARWQANGTLDTGFGSGGLVTTRIGGGVDVAKGLVFQPDGRIVIAGSAALARYESGLCCTGGPCMECGVCQACGMAGCEEAPTGAACPDEGNLCTSDTCDGAGTCLHHAEPAPVCDEPQVAAAALLKIRSSTRAGKDRVLFKWAKGAPSYPRDPYTMRFCVYDRSGGGYSLAYQGSPSVLTDGIWSFGGSTNYTIKFKSKTGQPDGITGVVQKINATAAKTKAQVKAAGDLALAPFPLQQDPAVVAQIRWNSGQCWGATFSSAARNDAAQFTAKSD